MKIVCCLLPIVMMAPSLTAYADSKGVNFNNIIEVNNNIEINSDWPSVEIEVVNISPDLIFIDDDLCHWSRLDTYLLRPDGEIKKDDFIIIMDHPDYRMLKLQPGQKFTCLLPQKSEDTRASKTDLLIWNTRFIVVTKDGDYDFVTANGVFSFNDTPPNKNDISRYKNRDILGVNELE